MGEVIEMKKFGILLLILTFLLCACTQEQTPETQPESSAQTQPSATETEPTLQTTEETMSEPTEAAADPLSDEELAQMQELFADPTGWYARALTSLYDSPEMLDMNQLFYCGAGDTPVSDEELAYLKTVWPETAFEFDIIRCDKAVMKETLTYYLGTDYQDMDGIGMGKLTYYSESAAYFRSSSDTNIMVVTLERGERLENGDVVLYYDGTYPHGGMCAVTLRMAEDHWVIRSNCLV